MNDPDDLMLYERDLQQILAEMNRQHREHIRPFVDRLVLIRSLWPPPLMVITIEQTEALLAADVIRQGVG